MKWEKQMFKLTLKVLKIELLRFSDRFLAPLVEDRKSLCHGASSVVRRPSSVRKQFIRYRYSSWTVSDINMEPSLMCWTWFLVGPKWNLDLSHLQYGRHGGHFENLVIATPPER